VIHCLKFLVVIAAVTFDVWGGLNVTGFCFSEMRYVPDKEFFARYLESAGIYLRHDLNQVRGLTGDPNVKSFESFEKGSDYLQKYPDCCSHGPQVGIIPDSDYPPSFFQRFFGLVWGLAAIRYHLEYVNGASQTTEYQSFTQGWATSCGYSVRRH
jgi:hypothetical protein